MLHFSVLGPLEVRAGDHLVVITRQPWQAVLAYLLLRPGRVVSIDELVDAV